MAKKLPDRTPPNTPHVQCRMYSPSIDAMMREVLHTLGNIDFQHQVELEKLEQSNTDEKLKKYIQEKIRAAHREKREPYVNLLTTLREQQYRLSFAS